MSSSTIVRLASERTLPTSSRRIDSAEREISLLREYRTRLIADVVTGKLDVREAAARAAGRGRRASSRSTKPMLRADAEEVDDEVEAVAEEAEA